MKNSSEIIYEKAILKFGVHAQMNMAIEECAELIQAINKWRRNPSIGMGNIAEEIADVEIMCSQLRLMLHGLDRSVDEIKESKITRLDNYINKES